MAGDYVIGLSQGRWFVDETSSAGVPWDASGQYTVDGNRITLRIVDNLWCFGGTMSANWSLSRTALTLGRISSSMPESCGPGSASTWTAILGSQPLTRVF